MEDSKLTYNDNAFVMEENAYSLDQALLCTSTLPDKASFRRATWCTLCGGRVKTGEEGGHSLE